MYDGSGNGAGPRIVQPKYEYDPHGVYQDLNVQAWAQYYASGGTDLAGAGYFLSIPGLTEHQSVSADANASEPSQPIASGSQTQHRSPRGPRSIRSRRGVVSLLEFLHIGSSKKQRPSVPAFTPFNHQPANNPPPLTPNDELTEDFADEDNASITPEELEVPHSNNYLPTYAESVFESAPTAYATGKASFSASVHFGESIEPSPRPLPFPRPVSPQAFNDDKAPRYETIHVSYIETIDTTEVPSRLSLIEESLADGEARNTFKPIYHNLMTLLLQEVTPVNSSTTNSVIDTLNDYAVSLRSFDGVTSLVQSHIYRGSLLQVASVLGLSDDPRVRRALQEDETDIARILHRVSLSDIDREAVMALEGDEAQSFLNVVQDVLDRGFLLDDPDESLKARRLLVKLSSNCYKLPAKLFIEGVIRSDEHATFGGGFGDVFRGIYEGKVVALKRMRIFQRDTNLSLIRRKFCQEALTWQSMKHTYIVPFLGIMSEEFPTVLCMVSPWMRHGTILKYLSDHGRTNVNKRLHEITQGLDYLHSQHIVHGDLRGANILINDDWQACLTDFGLTVFNDATPATYTSRHEGSVRWMAPELYFPHKFGLERFRLTPASDVYAFACVCVELYTGHAPFADTFHDPAIILKVTEGKRPDRPLGTDPVMSDELWRLIEVCWSQHFADRPSIREVVKTLRDLTHPPLHILPIFDEPGIVEDVTALDVLEGPEAVIEKSSVRHSLPSIEGLLGLEALPETIVQPKHGPSKRVHFDETPETIFGSTEKMRERYEAARRDTERFLSQDQYFGEDTKSAFHEAPASPDHQLWVQSVNRWLNRSYSSNGVVGDADSETETDSTTTSSSAVEELDSSMSSAFDPDLLVSPRKVLHGDSFFDKDPVSVEPPVDVLDEESSWRRSRALDYDIQSDTDSTATASVAGDKLESLPADSPMILENSESSEFTCLLSSLAALVHTKVPKVVCLWRGELYPNSFTNDDLVTTIENLLKDSHDPSDTPLPLASLASDVAWSLFTQGAFQSVEPVKERSQNNVYFFEEEKEIDMDKGPKGVFPMLSGCYSPTCTQDRPCFSYSCPLWGKPESPSRLQDAQILSESVPKLIPVVENKSTVRPSSTRIGMEEDADGYIKIFKTPGHHPTSLPLAAAHEEGDILNSYWDLMDEMDGAFRQEFTISDFSEEVKTKVEAILQPPAPKRRDLRTLRNLLVLLLSLLLLYAITTYFILPHRYLLSYCCQLPQFIPL